MENLQNWKPEGVCKKHMSFIMPHVKLRTYDPLQILKDDHNELINFNWR